MAELEIDQSNLPRVQEVCQSFAVLEDGALAHNLQEQEIEQYYTTNIQKNQLVQNDIRVAKRLQDEEEEQRAQQSAFLKEATKQIEEQDFEYARMIQEELQRHAEEAHQREQNDEEIAKQLQEEEEQNVRRRSRGHEGHSEGASLEPSEASLDLGELHQVLQDEELARTLQEEEEKLLRRNSQPSPPSSYPEGDFRVAQVAQDEEIARFMQKQEIKSKRRSRELEGPASWREHRAMISHHDRSSERDSTQWAFRPRLRTALQKTSHQAPFLLYQMLSRYETLQRSWTRPSKPGETAQRDKQDQPVGHFLCHNPACKTSSKNRLSSRQQSGKQRNQDGVNPKRRRRTASSNKHITVRGNLFYIRYFQFSDSSHGLLL